MKLPFNIIFSNLLKPHFGQTRLFCQRVMFSISVPYTYFFGTLGLFVNVNCLKKHLGTPMVIHSEALVHDLKIIATAMGLVQYVCLLAGCITENPVLFLPHLIGQFVAIVAKVLSAVALLNPSNFKSVLDFGNIAVAVTLMSFNWLQEFCVFRQSLCICDL